MRNPAVILHAVAAVWALLCCASLLVVVLVRLRPQADLRDLVLRIRGWWGILAVSTAALLLGRSAVLCFLAFVSFQALKEFFSAVLTRSADRYVVLCAYLAIVPQFYFASSMNYGLFLTFIPVALPLLLLSCMAASQATDGFIAAAATIQWGLTLCVFALSHLAFLYVLPAGPGSRAAGGPGLLLFLVFLTQWNDISQYVVGRIAGRHKLLPRISPNKTWEGLAGGILSTTLAALLLAPHLTPFTPRQSAIAGLLLSIVGFLGDATISAIKRDAGVKDMGALIPGHGGVLDRVDSLLFTAPLFFHWAYRILY